MLYVNDCKYKVVIILRVHSTCTLILIPMYAGPSY
jgi:hypothetical protein